MAILPREPLKFERQHCTRCGGSGRYSFNLMHGDRCFGCAGSGITLTKRGAAAQAWLRDFQSVEAKDVQVGMRVRGAGFKQLTVRVIEVRSDGSYSLNNGGEGMKNFTWIVGPTQKVQVLPTSEEQRVYQLGQALAYEATLGKNGKPTER